ncbi:unnamed protein product [Blepharisma stoltei]|uniref:Uncharacterized protein n=1 Tax=Blepharisma stoltei TaxID=1481888 RepID=A0AAU9KHA6_9CILI|nr:unnamed protein product [Blepharisma stoltei]
METRSETLIYATQQKKKRLLSSKASLSLFTVTSSVKITKLFIAKVLARDIPKLKTVNLIENNYYNKINFMQDIEIITILIPLLTYNLQEDLCFIIKMSNKSNLINLAASNSIFILNRAGFEFRNLDFRGINIQGVNLSESLFFNVNFEGSCLEKANFSQAKLYSCNFKNCNFAGAIFSNFQTIREHESSIKNVIVSKNGEFWLICSFKDTILWDVNKNTQLFSFDFVCESAAFSPCNNLIVLMDYISKRFINWDGKSIKICEKEDKIFNIGKHLCNVAFSPCGKYIAFRGMEFIELNDSVNYNIYKGWVTHTNSSIAFTKCGKFIVFGSYNWIKQISVENGRCDDIFKVNGVPNILEFSPNYKYLCCNGDFLYIINFETKELIFREDWIQLTFRSLICWSPCEDMVAFSDWSGLRLFDIEKQAIIAQLRVNSSIFRSICYSKNSKSVLISYQDGWLKLWDLESQKDQKQIDVIENYVIAVAFSRCEQYLYRVTSESAIDKYNIDSKSFETIIKGNKKKKISCAAFSNCKTYCALGLDGNSIELWNLDTGQLYIAFKENTKFIYSLTFSSSGVFLFSVHNFSIIIWNLEQRKSIAKLEHDTKILAISPNEKYFASSHNEVTLIWKKDRRYNMINHFRHNRWSVTALAFSYCSNFLFTGNAKGYIIMWDFINKKKLNEFSAHKTSVEYLITTPKGLVIGMNTQIVLWDDKTNEKINEIEIKLESVNNFATTKSGDWVAFGGLHNTVKMCRLSEKN